jgi:uncharacterized protein YjbI with pentapeptide repeats
LKLSKIPVQMTQADRTQPKNLDAHPDRVSAIELSNHLIRHPWRRWVVMPLLVFGLGLIFLAGWCGWAEPAWAENYNRFSLVGADFSNQDLRDDDFTKANLREANFHNANLEGVRFFAANLESANLSGANLRNSTLDSARLVNADLTNAVLEGAFAASINIPGVKITGADFTDVLLRSDTLDKLCAVADGVNPVTGRATRDTLLCP